MEVLNEGKESTRDMLNGRLENSKRGDDVLHKGPWVERGGCTSEAEVLNRCREARRFCDTTCCLGSSLRGCKQGRLKDSLLDTESGLLEAQG